MIIGLIDIVVFIAFIITFKKAIGIFMTIGKKQADNEGIMTDALVEENKKGSKFMLIAILLLGVSIVLTLCILWKLFIGGLGSNVAI